MDVFPTIPVAVAGLFRGGMVIMVVAGWRSIRARKRAGMEMKRHVQGMDVPWNA